MMENYQFKKYHVPPPLSKYIRCFTLFKSEDFSERRIIPTGSAEMTIRVDNGITDAQILITHLASTYKIVRPQMLGEMIGVCFQPWGFYGLFKIPQEKIADVKLPLKDVLGSKYATLGERLRGKRDPSEIIDILSSYLLSILPPKANEDVVDAVYSIHRNSDSIDIRSLCKKYNLSTRRLQQLFKINLGMSAKMYCRLKNFHSSVALLKRDEHLTRLALSQGYYDQAHFIHSFKAFAGVSPTKFLSEINMLNQLNQAIYF